MSSMPPEQPTAQQQQQQPGGSPPPGQYGGRGPGSGPNVNFNLGAIMPTPGNAELVVYILATILIGIVALSADNYDAHGFASTFGWITAAYLISRGIAKASRVLER